MSARRKLYIGPQIRRLRRERGLTQAEMAGALDVSPSYVNLIERNQRPISAELLVRLAAAFDLDIGAFSERGDLEAELITAMQDPIFASAGVTRGDAVDLAGGNPALGEAVAALYRAWRQAQDEALDAQISGRAAEKDPVEDARAFIQIHANHFPALDALGEAFWEAIDRDAAGKDGATEAGPASALIARLKSQHGLRVRFLPAAVMAGAVRRHDRHARELRLAETLDGASRQFHLALQLTLIEHAGALDRLVNAAKFETDAGRRLARAALANYGAAALIMPYARFLAAARELNYDIEALARRFRASFEQVAHRLATLRRPGAEGVPFFFLRVDAAGNVSKRFSGDVFPFARYGGSCPLWNVHDTFRTPRAIATQIVQLPDGQKFFSIARTVHAEAGGFDAPKIDRAVALGCALEHASALIYARGLDLAAAQSTPIGVTCRLCDRTDCAARAHPPLRRRLVMDEHRRLATPFSFEFG